MEEFVRSYGVWILLGAVFLGMHWFGMGCGGHRHGAGTDDTPAEPGEGKKPPPRSGGCH